MESPLSNARQSPERAPRRLPAGQKRRYEITPPGDDYFKYLNIQPGSAFFRSLLECKYPIHSLSLNVPTMLINLGATMMLKTGIIIII